MVLSASLSREMIGKIPSIHFSKNELAHQKKQIVFYPPVLHNHQ